MAQIHLLWAGVIPTVSRSVVAVKSFRFCGAAAEKRKSGHFDNPDNFNPTSYKVCTGFILEANRTTTFIAVHMSHLNLDDSDLIAVVFHDGVVAQAKPFIRDRGSELVILMVALRSRSYPIVYCQKIDRADIIVLSDDGNNITPYSASIINPTTESVSARDCTVIVNGTEQWFSFGCDADTEDILGAPIFSSNGSFAGIISGDDVSVKHKNGNTSQRSVADLKYGLHAENFLSNLRMEIKDKFDPHWEKKTKDMAKRRR